MTISVKDRPLYGGAITANVPPSFMDASEIREVPDNQEVFIDIETDQSIIVELLELEGRGGDELIRKHFWQLADDNDAREGAEILSSQEMVTSLHAPGIPADAQVWFLKGSQIVAKYNESSPNAKNFLFLYMAVIRLQNVTTDILVTLNHPLVLGPAGSSAHSGVMSIGDAAIADQRFKDFVHSFSIKDWSLFAS